jgi:hypothetical protein
MSELTDKIREFGRQIASEKGDLSLLGLFQRESGIGNWDLVVAAPWVNRKNRTADIPYLAGKLQAALKPLEMASIAVIVPLHSSVPFVQWVHDMVGEVEGLRTVPTFEYDGMILRTGYVLVSQPDRHTGPRSEAKAAAT